jgi:signal transduction histidine kinase
VDAPFRGQGDVEVSVERSSTTSSTVRLRVVADGRVLYEEVGFPNLPVELDVGLQRIDDVRVVRQARREDDVAFQVDVASDADPVAAPRLAYGRALVLILPVATLALAVTSWIVAGRLSAPLARLERVATSIRGRDDLRLVVPETRRTDEIGRLARALEAAFARMADALERERDFTNAAAHDLRSPLAALRTRVESALRRDRSSETYRSTLQEVLVDVDRLTRLSNHLLLLASGAEHEVVTSVDLDAIVGSEVARTRTDAPDASVHWKAQWGGTVHGDPDLMAHAVRNLLHNAVLHGAGADVYVEVRPAGHGEVVVRVRDEGPGIDLDATHDLGAPFVRGDRARRGEGSGLGLAIVRRVAETFGGRLELASQPGEGFEANLYLRVETERSTRS